MSNATQSLFGVHTRALNLWNRRMSVLASNIANADTPHYQARDIDFRAALSASRTPSVTLATTQAGHLGGTADGHPVAPLKYRVPMQPSQDGNTVDGAVAKAEFARNTIHYRASLAFISHQIKMMRLAIGGR